MSLLDPGEIKDLLRLCETGDLVRIKNCVHQTSSPIEALKDAEGFTPLQVASANAHAHVVEYLLISGAKVDDANANGWTSLHHAAFHGHTEVCQLLLQHHASVLLKNKLGATSINIAVAGGHVSTIDLLLKHGAQLDEDLPSQYLPCPNPMITASIFGRDSALRRLVELKPSLLNSTTSDSFWTPLMFASANGFRTTAQLLVDSGADPDRINARNMTALDIATQCDSPEVRAYLQTKTSAKTVEISGVSAIDKFFDAVRQGDMDATADLLTNEIVDVDMTDGMGGTGLMAAALGGHLDIVQLLVHLGANLDLQDDANGWTALMQATFYCHKTIAKYLLNSGADPNVVAFNGCTALDLACLMEETDSELLRLLASKAIEKDPPTLSFHPVKAKPKAAKRSLSTTALDKLGEERGGFKSWLKKLSHRFKRTTSNSGVGPGVSIFISPDPDDAFRDKSNMIIESLHEKTGINSAVFTLGFSAATSNLSSHSMNGITAVNNSFRLRSNQNPTFNIPSGLARSTHRGPQQLPVGKGKRDVTAVLAQVQLQHLTDLFRSHEVDFRALLELSDLDLQEIGVENEADRGKLTALIKWHRHQ